MPRLLLGLLAIIGVWALGFVVECLGSGAYCNSGFFLVS